MLTRKCQTVSYWHTCSCFD